MPQPDGLQSALYGFPSTPAVEVSHHISLKHDDGGLKVVRGPGRITDDMGLICSFVHTTSNLMEGEFEDARYVERRKSVRKARRFSTGSVHIRPG